MIRRTLLAALFLSIAFAPAAAAQDFPEFTNYVVDDAGVIPDELEDRINAELESFEERMDMQLAVAVIDTIGDEILENYVIDLAREWKVGAEGGDNGILFFLAIEDRTSRIEVGEEVEGDMTDVESGRILRGQMRTLLQQGDYGQAVLIATRQIRAAVGDTDTGAPPPQVQDEPSNPVRGIGSWAWIIPFLIFGPLSAIGRRGQRRRGWLAPVFWGAGWGGLGGGRGGGGGFGGGGFGGGGGGGGFGGGGASGDW